MCYINTYVINTDQVLINTSKCYGIMKIVILPLYEIKQMTRIP